MEQKYAATITFNLWETNDENARRKLVEILDTVAELTGGDDDPSVQMLQSVSRDLTASRNITVEANSSRLIMKNDQRDLVEAARSAKKTDNELTDALACAV